jgi:hypothetical protein
MQLNPLPRIFVLAFSLVFFALAIESIPHSIHHIGEPENGKTEKSCPFFDLWLQGSSSTIPDFSITLLTCSQVVDYLFALNENPYLKEFYTGLPVRSPPNL